MIRYVIDGHNFIHHVGRYLELLDRDYVRCIKTLYVDLLNYADTRQVEILLALDGEPPWSPSEESPNLKVEFSGSRRSADAVIVSQAENWKGRQTVVVSEDKGILREAASLGCKILRPSEFNRLMRKKRAKRESRFPSSGKFDGLTKSDTEWWKKEMKRALADKKKKEE